MIINMNKKGEFVLLSLIAITIVVFGVFYLEQKILTKEKINYVGDTFTKKAYNLHSKNPNCNLNSIKISRENLIFFENRYNVELEGFIIEPICD